MNGRIEEVITRLEVIEENQRRIMEGMGIPTRGLDEAQSEPLADETGSSLIEAAQRPAGDSDEPHVSVEEPQPEPEPRVPSARAFNLQSEPEIESPSPIPDDSAGGGRLTNELEGTDAELLAVLDRYNADSPAAPPGESVSPDSSSASAPAEDRASPEAAADADGGDKFDLTPDGLEEILDLDREEGK